MFGMRLWKKTVPGNDMNRSGPFLRMKSEQKIQSSESGSENKQLLASTPPIQDLRGPGGTQITRARVKTPVFGKRISWREVAKSKHEFVSDESLSLIISKNEVFPFRFGVDDLGL